MATFIASSQTQIWALVGSAIGSNQVIYSVIYNIGDGTVCMNISCSSLFSLFSLSFILSLYSSPLSVTLLYIMQLLRQNGLTSTSLINTSYSASDSLCKWSISVYPSFLFFVSLSLSSFEFDLILPTYSGTNYVIRNVASGWYLYQSSTNGVALKATLTFPIPANSELWKFSSANIIPS